MTIQGSGANIEKRDVMICDNSGASIWLTLWSKKVQHFQNNELEGNPLVAFKGTMTIQQTQTIVQVSRLATGKAGG